MNNHSVQDHVEQHKEAITLARYSTARIELLIHAAFTAGENKIKAANKETLRLLKEQLHFECKDGNVNVEYLLNLLDKRFNVPPKLDN